MAISGAVQVVKIVHVEGIDRQAVHQQLASGRGALGKLGDRRPRRLLIDVIRREEVPPQSLIPAAISRG